MRPRPQGTMSSSYALNDVNDPALRSDYVYLNLVCITYRFTLHVAFWFENREFDDIIYTRDSLLYPSSPLVIFLIFAKPRPLF